MRWPLRAPCAYSVLCLVNNTAEVIIEMSISYCSELQSEVGISALRSLWGENVHDVYFGIKAKYFYTRSEIQECITSSSIFFQIFLHFFQIFLHWLLPHHSLERTLLNVSKNTYFPSVKENGASMGKRSSRLLKYAEIKWKILQNATKHKNILCWPSIASVRAFLLGVSYLQAGSCWALWRVSNFTTYPWNIVEICTASACAGLSHPSITVVSWGIGLNYAAISAVHIRTPALLGGLALHSAHRPVQQGPMHPQDRNPQKPVLLRLEQNKSVQREKLPVTALYYFFFPAELHVLNHVFAKVFRWCC